MAENLISSKDVQDSPYEWLAKKIAPFAGVLALGYVYAYILGYAYLWRLYATLGAPWAMDLLDFATIARTPTIGAVLLLVASSAYASPWIRLPDIKISAVITAFAITLAAFIAEFLNTKWTQPYELHLKLLVEISLLISLFFLFCNLTHRSREKMGARKSAVFMSSMVAASIFLITPIFAENSAKEIRQSGGKYLPKIALKDNDKEPSWRLVRYLNSDSLLALRPTEKRSVQFKIIESTSVESIAEPDPLIWTATQETALP